MFCYRLTALDRPMHFAVASSTSDGASRRSIRPFATLLMALAGLCVASAASAYEEPPAVGISSMANNPPRFAAAVYKTVPPGTKSLTLEIHVDAQGKWISTAIIRSSGWAAIDAAYLKVSERWEYRVGVRDGERVAGIVRLPVSFCLVTCDPEPAATQEEPAEPTPVAAANAASDYPRAIAISRSAMRSSGTISSVAPSL